MHLRQCSACLCLGCCQVIHPLAALGGPRCYSVRQLLPKALLGTARFRYLSLEPQNLSFDSLTPAAVSSQQSAPPAVSSQHRQQSAIPAVSSQQSAAVSSQKHHQHHTQSPAPAPPASISTIKHLQLASKRLPLCSVPRAGPNIARCELSFQQSKFPLHLLHLR